ncbi:MAG: hypothetical protein PHF11_01575 [Candidatus Omnitrophica bacterium]|nr:hypothetical protein [Candidatus Omnitrophota bacterium]
MNKMLKWVEQYDRMIRWYERIKNINHGILHNRDSRFYEDEVHAFFINCYHLKDWILHDKTLKIIEKDKKLKDFINNSSPLKICHDICNGLKHLELDKPKIDKNTQFKSRHYSLELGGEKLILSAKYSIQCGGKTFDAFSLATSCIEAWKDFIKNNKIN